MLASATEIVRIVRYHEYHPMSWDELKPNPNCPLCGKSLGHSITLIVMDQEGDHHEIHAYCMKG